jgi:hypothetical protein
VSLRPDDIPTPWRQPFALLLFIVFVAAGSLALGAWIRSEARAETRVAVSEDWAVQVRKEATEAATAAAKAAVREAVADVAKTVEIEKRGTEERFRAIGDRIDKLDRRVERLEERR